MTRRRNCHPGITELAWRYLTDCVTAEDGADRESWELGMLESDQHDHETGYRTREIWEKYRDQILAVWIQKHPGSRPWSWWQFDSGLPHVQQIRPVRPREIIEDARNKAYTYWCVGWHPDNKRRLIDEEREQLRHRFVMDQRTWLAEHGLLEPNE